MVSSKKELLQALERLKGVPVLVVGDLILDRYLWGKVSRISPEAPVPIIEVNRTEDRLGGAANVARNLSAIGVDVRMAGYVGNDAEGETVRTLLQNDKISADAVVSDEKRPTSLKTRIIAHHQQVCRVDREDVTTRESTIQKLLLEKIRSTMLDSKAVILSDYGKGVVSAPLIEVLEHSREKGELSLKTCPLVVDPHPANYGIYEGMSVAKPNRKEAELATGIPITNKASAIEAANVLLSLWKAEMMMITLGEDGLVIAFADGSPPILLETRARQVFDVSGAGDTVTALFTAAIAAGCSPRIAGELANIGAGIVVSEVGTVAVSLDKIRAEIEEYN